MKGRHGKVLNNTTVILFSRCQTYWDQVVCKGVVPQCRQSQSEPRYHKHFILRKKNIDLFVFIVSSFRTNSSIPFFFIFTNTSYKKSIPIFHFTASSFCTNFIHTYFFHILSFFTHFILINFFSFYFIFFTHFIHPHFFHLLYHFSNQFHSYFLFLFYHLFPHFIRTYTNCPHSYIISLTFSTVPFKNVLSKFIYIFFSFHSCSLEILEMSF